MYKNLVEIGLKDFLNDYFCNQDWVMDKCIENIDAYVKIFDEDQKQILLNKFKNQKDFRRANDSFYELWIAYVFHQNGKFQIDYPDIIENGENIEVKNINTTPEELDRIKTLQPNIINDSPFPEDLNLQERFNLRFERQINKALPQISHRGKIYLIWDTTIKGFSKNKEEITRILNNLCDDKKIIYPKVEIIHLYFGDLKERVVNTVLIVP